MVAHLAAGVRLLGLEVLWVLKVCKHINSQWTLVISKRKEHTGARRTAKLQKASDTRRSSTQTRNAAPSHTTVMHSQLGLLVGTDLGMCTSARALRDTGCRLEQDCCH